MKVGHHSGGCPSPPAHATQPSPPSWRTRRRFSEATRSPAAQMRSREGLRPSSCCWRTLKHQAARNEDTQRCASGVCNFPAAARRMSLCVCATQEL